MFVRTRNPVGNVEKRSWALTDMRTAASLLRILLWPALGLILGLVYGMLIGSVAQFRYSMEALAFAVGLVSGGAAFALYVTRDRPAGPGRLARAGPRLERRRPFRPKSSDDSREESP